MSGELDFDKLKSLTCKLRCIGYYIETQDPNHVHPVDFDEVQFGLSLILNEITNELNNLGDNDLEKKIT